MKWQMCKNAVINIISNGMVCFTYGKQYCRQLMLLLSLWRWAPAALSSALVNLLSSQLVNGLWSPDPQILLKSGYDLLWLFLCTSRMQQLSTLWQPRRELVFFPGGLSAGLSLRDVGSGEIQNRTDIFSGFSGILRALKHVCVAQTKLWQWT